MKVHFIGDLSGNTENYKQIVETVEKLGHTVVTKHFLERKISDLEGETEAEAELYAKKMKSWMSKADVIMVEATKPGLGSGYEIATSLSMSKPVVVLYKNENGNTPHVLLGIQSDKLQVLNYDVGTLKDIVEVALDFASDAADVRFNFFISPAIGNYLDWISKEKKIPRSVYLRSLIEKDMDSNDEYNS